MPVTHGIPRRRSAGLTALLAAAAWCTTVIAAGVTAPADGTGAAAVPVPSPSSAGTAASAVAPTTAALREGVSRTADAAAFSQPVFLASSSGAVEPRIAVDGGDVLITASTGLSLATTGHLVSNGASTAGGVSPLWRSRDGGASFEGPLAPTQVLDTANYVGGRTADIAVDAHGDVAVVTSWLGGMAVSTSSDHGSTWSGLPVAHPTPVDDHSWLAYDRRADVLYAAWSGADGVHVGRAVLRGVGPASPAQAVFVQDVLAVPQLPVAVPSQLGAVPVRQGMDPVGGVTVDAAGAVWVVYTRANADGAGVIGTATSQDGGLTWTDRAIPGSGAAGDAASVDYDMPGITADSAGNVYVAWAQMTGAASTQVWYAWFARGAAAWHAPVRISGVATAALPAVVAAGPGVLDVVYYGTDQYAGDPSAVDGTATWVWGLYLTQVGDATATHTATTAQVARYGHAGPLCARETEEQCRGVDGVAGSGGGDVGEGLGITVDASGMADITAVLLRNVGSGARILQPELAFVHQDRPLRARAAGAPSTAPRSVDR